MLLRNGHKDVHDLWIELRARAALDLGTRMRERQRLPIGAIADHGVQGVRDGENASAQWDLLAFQRARIARSIEKFLVRQYDLRSGTQKWNANQHVVADFAVRAHDLLFV